ncbi:hypothetical protein [Actinomadura sp. BRA 177]|uniref:hypothetical protein n=1 Tax=Actinomadura sp. BRA 177 TaxID=2745202 RepID=UPI001595D774|nr:hypothetical protein [Actinomadura sp. BRA 177]NVI86918.1 hypothetical protein [Actinomadura sp. BRA 177]
MEHRRLDDRVPDPGLPGDTHVAGPAPKPPAMDAPEPVPDTAPDPMPAADPVRAAHPVPEAVPAAPPAEEDAAPAKLLDAADAERFRERWHEVQASFIDDPGEAVRRADDLASDAVDALGRAIAAHRRTLSEALDGGERPGTEGLRLALRDYRDLLDRIFAA